MAKIGFAHESDILEIMSFINSEWKKGHILAKNENFFRYEHQHDESVDFVISRDDNSINGILGFKRTSYDSIPDAWTVMWKVKKNNQNPILGIRLLDFLLNSSQIRNVLSVGINQKTFGLYRYLGMHTDSLRLYAIINYSLDQYQIAKINSPKPYFPKEKLPLKNYKIKPLRDFSDLDSFDFQKSRKFIPFKDKKYFFKRYLNHPIYNYRIFEIYKSNQLIGLFVTRTQSHNEARIIRIVDFYGDEESLKPFGIFLHGLIRKEKLEYADFYCFGLKHNLLLESGFESIDLTKDSMIIPNYFSPFALKNIPIYFFSDPKTIQFLRLFKADGDQDRPS